MSRLTGLTLVLVGMCATVGLAATVTFEIEGQFGSCNPVEANGTVKYAIIAKAGYRGLAGFCIDVETNTGVTQSQQAEAGPGMESFVGNDGYTNSAGFGGVTSSDDLLQIGGGQNTLGIDRYAPETTKPSGPHVHIDNAHLTSITASST